MRLKEVGGRTPGPAAIPAAARGQTLRQAVPQRPRFSTLSQFSLSHAPPRLAAGTSVARGKASRGALRAEIRRREAAVSAAKGSSVRAHELRTDRPGSRGDEDAHGCLCPGQAESARSRW